MLLGYVGSNFRRHRLQSVTTLMPVSGSPEVVCRCVADIATGVDAIAAAHDKDAQVLQPAQGNQGGL